MNLKIINKKQIKLDYKELIATQIGFQSVSIPFWYCVCFNAGRTDLIGIILPIVIIGGLIGGVLVSLKND